MTLKVFVFLFPVQTKGTHKSKMVWQDKMQYVGSVSNSLLFENRPMNKKVSGTLVIMPWYFIFSPNSLLDSLLCGCLLFMHWFLLFPSKTITPFPLRAEDPEYNGSASWGQRSHAKERS